MRGPTEKTPVGSDLAGNDCVFFVRPKPPSVEPVRESDNYDSGFRVAPRNEMLLPPKGMWRGSTLSSSFGGWSRVLLGVFAR